MSTSKRVSLSHLLDWFPQIKSLRVLEIGCGSADHVPAMRALDNLSEYVGVDLDEAAIQKAKAQWPQATFICGDASRLAGQYNGYFDTILICRPDLFARPKNWTHVFATLPALLTAQGRVVLTTMAASEADSAQAWLETGGMTILHAEELEASEEAFLLVAEHNQANRSKLKIVQIDSLQGEAMYCDPVTGVCYLPSKGNTYDTR
jgi:ribosomal protein L11 methylase PrmA